MAGESLAVLDEIAFEADAPKTEDAPKKETGTGRKPPKEGICKRCGQDKPINRLMLCYACWVISEIEDREKREGRIWTTSMAHPAWCACSIPGKHPGRSGQNVGGN